MDSFMMVDKYDRFETQNTIAVSLSELAEKSFYFGVEDSPTMARFLAEQMGVPVKLFDRPWNQTVPSTRKSSVTTIGAVCRSRGLALIAKSL